jgi:hypothetical protein
VFPNGSSYRGQIDAEQQPHGEGVHLHLDGSELYRGNWAGGQRHGRGVLTDKGHRYEGEWMNDNQHGQGRYQWKDGSVYAGNWVAGLKEGVGQYTWPNGDTFEGHWKQDMRDNFGVERSKDGRIIHCGLWKDDELVESRPVPISKLLEMAFLSDAGQFVLFTPVSLR